MIRFSAYLFIVYFTNFILPTGPKILTLIGAQLSQFVFSFEGFYINSLTLLFVKKQKKSFVSGLFLLSGCLILVFFHSLTGSRNAPVLFLAICIFSFLVFRGNYIKIYFMPFLFFIALVLYINFYFSELIRNELGDIERLKSFSKSVEIIKSERQETFMENSNLNKMFKRIGYLDFANELILNRPVYKEIFTIHYYLKSLVDNMITPGFDIFDTPRLSTATRFFYDYNESPSNKKVRDGYHSDQFTIYGESYCLFGTVGGTFFIYVIISFFSFLYVWLNKEKNSPTIAAKKVLILLSFYYLLNNYGMDSIIIACVGNYLSLIVGGRILDLKKYKL